ncbi:acyl-CoA N-acyltransferase [Mycena filopes]|nr:acyl-CoA N-acyltransferase [Mycena filopes]
MSDIYIRKFRASDFPQVRVLLFEGFVTGKGSVASMIKRDFAVKTFSRIGCVSLLGTLALAWKIPVAEWNPKAICAGAAAILALGSSVVAVLRVLVTRAINGFCEAALARDMRDISASYQAPAAFFVAVRPAVVEKPHRDDDLMTVGEEPEEVVGMVGLEFLPEQDAKAAEIKRMIVSPTYRRFGLASRLMLETIRHAETMPGVEFIKLSTSQFQFGAQRLYEGLGWEHLGTHKHQVGIINATVRDYRRPVRKGEASELQARAAQGAELRRTILQS